MNFLKLFLAECIPTDNMHGPDESVLVREFLNALAIICFHLHRLKKVLVLLIFNNEKKHIFSLIY